MALQPRHLFGRTDIVAMILKKYTSLDVGRALPCSDLLISFGTFFVFGVETGLFTLTGLFAKAYVIDGVIENMNLCQCFMIVTERPDVIEPYMLQTLHHSATRIDAVGAYTEKAHLDYLNYIKTRIDAVGPTQRAARNCCSRSAAASRRYG
ncbi:MAG: YitT family protein [Eubacteriales bacterium]